MKRYYVKFKVLSRYTAEVEADTPEEAKEKAAQKFKDAHFGDAEDIDGKIISIADENGLLVS